MSYQFFSQIDILASAVGEDEQNFPVVLVVTDSRFATTGNGGHIENTDAGGGVSGGLTVPADLVVGPNEDGSSEYDFEFVAYNAATGYMEFWVKIVALSSSVDTPVIFAYGDSGVTTSQEDVTGVWSNNYAAVWHLDETGANPTCLDSTGNGEDSVANDADPIAGKINGAMDYIAANTDTTTLTNCQNGAKGAIEAWVKWDIVDNVYRHIVYDVGAGYIGIGLHPTANKVYFSAYDTGGKAAVGGTTISAGTWYYTVGIYNPGEKVQVYLQGALDGTSPEANWVGPLGSTALALKMGTNGITYLDGKVDELRVRDVRPSSNWIATCYNNQKAPTPSSTFWSALGSEVTYFTADAIIKKVPTGSLTADARITGHVTVSGTVKDLDGDPVNNARVIIINQADNTILGTTTTNEQGEWSLADAVGGGMTILAAAYNPSDDTQDGDAAPHIEVPA